MINARSLMSEVKFYESYSRHREDKGRRETWPEAVSRVMDMHKRYYAGKLSDELLDLMDEAEAAYADKLVLGSQRALQYGGDQLLAHNLRTYNCLRKDTRFVTDRGVKSFSDYEDGDEIVVLTHTGAWKKAVVKKYGFQQLNRITFKRGDNTVDVFATASHRWMLHDGTISDRLTVGDRLLKEPSIFHEFDWESACEVEKLYWCYGFVYGDGTINDTVSMVRLCGAKARFSSRFGFFGFKSSRSASLRGDVIYFTGKYDKSLPDVAQDDPSLIRAFVAGYLDADGHLNTNPGGKKFNGIQTSNESAAWFIRNVFPVAGVNVVNERDRSGEETNYGVRGFCKFFATSDTSGSKFNAGWKVRQIEETDLYEEVWCLEVDEDHSFVLEGGIVTGNCLSSYADRPEFFGEYFYALLCGCGVGYSVQKHHVASLPKIVRREKAPKIFEVPDSIEGWAQALDVLMSSFFENGGKHPEYKGHRVYFDLSKIRLKGAPISGGFIAPGPEPLRRSLDRIEWLLQGLVLRQPKALLAPIHVYDISCHVADAVLAGGVRRSATICIFSADDLEMMKAKTGNWFNENPQRARSNNSALLIRSELDLDQFHEIMRSVKEFGEPGFIFADTKDTATNPCVEIGMYCYYDDPETGQRQSGFQGCNLTEINGAACTSKEVFFAACRASAILGTLQAGYTDFKFMSPVTKKLFERESLLGCSITGWMNAPEILFDADTLHKGVAIIKKMNEKVAKLIGINPAARLTCVKPSGNASVLLGTASGINGEHSRVYIRNVQLNRETEVAKILMRTNPQMCEDSVWSAGNDDIVVSFPVTVGTNVLLRKNLIGIKLLEKIKFVQEHWVNEGTVLDRCVDKTIRHNVSNTVTVDHNWEAVTDYVYGNRAFFAGISFIPMAGDKLYNQAPFSEVLSENELVRKYGPAAIFSSGLVVEGLKIFDTLWDAVASVEFGIEERDEHIASIKRDWIRRFTKFANNYFHGDLTTTGYCLKDVHLFHRLKKIDQTFVPVDWEKELSPEKPERLIDVSTLAAVACSGPNGACELVF